MAMVAATAGGEFLNRDEMLALCDEQALMVFRPLEFLADEKMDKGVVKPVITDVYIVTGARAGEVRRSDKLIGNGITGTLRRTRIGDDCMSRMQRARNGATEYPAANPPGPDQLKIFQALPMKGDGLDWDALEAKYKAAQGIEPAADDDDAPF
jgi:hypothetical protein